MTGRKCDNCGQALPVPNALQLWCHDCDRLHGFDSPELETESLTDCLADIAGGLRTDSSGFWIADSPV